MKHVILKICNILTSDTNFTHTISILFELQAVERSSLRMKDSVFELFTL